MRVAVVSDSHGNLPALRAVLAEVEQLAPDAVVVLGDVASGPQPREAIELVAALPRARFVRGNGDREIVEAFDEGRSFDPDEPSPPRKAATWCAQRLERRHRDLLAAYEETVTLTVAGLGDVLFCHGTPRSDTEIVTSLTTDERLAGVLLGVTANLVVCGHTHVQYDRTCGGVRVVNAGSVGKPFEREPGAYWLALGPGVEHRRTGYDREESVRAAVATGWYEATVDGLFPPLRPAVAEVAFEAMATGS